MKHTIIWAIIGATILGATLVHGKRQAAAMDQCLATHSYNTCATELRS